MRTRARWSMSDNPTAAARRIVVGISGASGAAIGVRLLELLAQGGHAAHLVVTRAGEQVLAHETGRTLASLAPLVSKVYAPDDLTAPVASGSFRTDAMVVVPCSMKSLAGIAAGYADSLLLRAADVCLKERRRLVLVARESPLSLVHINNMRRVTEAGAIVLPPVLTFYHRPQTLEQVIDQVAGKVLDVLGIDSEVFHRWS